MKAQVTNKRLNPWHAVVSLKEEIRTGALALEEFAADLHDVTLGRNRRPVYEDPTKFFALTYPTHALRELVKDVATRLTGANNKAIRQLELTYGGGKTHTLITLYYLFRNPAMLPDLPAVREFREHIDTSLPQAFPVTLCFDKIDAERGLEDVRAPDGQQRRLLHPWSILAYQLAGSDGLRGIHPESKDEERDTPPAEPLLVKLIELPQRSGLSTLILVDEVLMYASVKASIDRIWAKRIESFFQYLTQAVTKVDNAAMVASILATDPKEQHGPIGGALADGLADIFRRQREETVQPVQKEDVAEVLRRRFFDTETIRDPNTYRHHVIGIVQSLARIDETIVKDRSTVETRFLNSFPFHPDLTDVFYSRWTQLEAFQRTRGILRTLAIALRSAEGWDKSPLVGPATFLSDPNRSSVSESVRELAGVATYNRVEGSTADWLTLLDAELGKAKAVQKELPVLQEHREIEQSVLAVFLHSQPIGHKANTPELIRMIGSSAPDRIELEKGLRRWRELSWFLDDDDLEMGDGASDIEELPKSWRLGNRPNLRQMHDYACKHRVKKQSVDQRLEEEIRSVKKMLMDGAGAAGGMTHLLPESPKDVADDGKFHYAVLGPSAVSESGKPSAVAKSFIDETGHERKPRVFRNALVLAVPSKDGLEAALISVRALLGWQDVWEQLKDHTVDPIRRERLNRRLAEAEIKASAVVKHAYEIVVTANNKNKVHAFKLRADHDNLFVSIKNDDRSRIQETPVDAAALLPGGPYNLWKAGEDSRFVSDLTEAFAKYPRLPKLLHRDILLETVLQGVKQGLIVARFKRPDQTFRTWWRQRIDDNIQRDPALEVVLPQKARLMDLQPTLLAYGELPGLWPTSGDDQALSVSKLMDYFRGGHTVSVSKVGYSESNILPACERKDLFAAIEQAVLDGTVWLISDPSSYWKELVPPGVLDDQAILHPRPDVLFPQDLTPEKVPSAWENCKTNGARLVTALSQQRRKLLPWGLVRESIKSAIDSRWLEVCEESTVYASCNYDQNANLWLRVRKKSTPPPPDTPSDAKAAVLECRQIQDLAELVPSLLKASVGSELRFRVFAEIVGERSKEAHDDVNRLLRTVSDDLKVG